MSQMRNVALIRVFRLSLQTFEALERWIGSWFGSNPSKFAAIIGLLLLGHCAHKESMPE